MTETLRSLLQDQARAGEVGPSDVDALVLLGERRLRRRRAVRVVASGTALALGGVAVGLMTTSRGQQEAVDPSGGSDRVAEAATPLDTDTVVWTRGSTLHTPLGTRDLGITPTAFVRTSVGYVLTDASGSVYAVDADSVERVGTTTTESARLVADPGGSLAAWVDPTGTEPTFVVLDQRRGTEDRDARHTSPTTPTGPEQEGTATVLGLDDRTLLLSGDDGSVAVDTDTGATTPVQVGPDSAAGLEGVVGAGGGLVAVTSQSPYGLRLGPLGGPSDLLPDVDGPSIFSADGRYVSVDADTLEIFDVRSRRRVDLALDRAFATGYDWLDDGRLVVVAARAARDDAEAELLTCRVDTGSCETVARAIGTFEELARDGALPNGRSIREG